MDELSELIQGLQKEVAQLEGKLRVREAEEEARLKGDQSRLVTAQARLDTANTSLETHAATLSILQKRRASLLARTEGWQGQLWRIGYGSAVAAAVLMMSASLLVVRVWFGGDWAFGMLTAQVVLLGGLLLTIPEKR